MQKKEPSSKQKPEANAAVFEEFFQDYWLHRHRIYAMNLVRGVWFGLGSVVGGTLVLTLLLWILSLFHQVSFLTDLVETIQRSIDEARR